MLSPLDTADLEQFVAALRKDYKKLSVRFRSVAHSVQCDCRGVTLRLHVPAVNQGKAKVSEVINALLDYMTTFALSRAELNAVAAEYGKIADEEYRIKRERLQRQAIDLFIKANRATNRNGEAGELLLYLLTEWILEAPQLIAKLALKTDRNAPVLGPDGIHIGYSKKKDSLVLYLGESKLIADVGQAITHAAKSIKTLQVIEEAIRFQTIRLFGCYRTILEYALVEVGAFELSRQILDVELFLEIGASSKTMVSFISLGLSRAVAIKLNGARSELDPELDRKEALEWLRSQSSQLASFGLSDLQIAEVMEMLRGSDNRND